MKTTAIKLPLVIFILFLNQFSFGQSSYSSDTYLVKFIPGATQTQIDQTRLELNSTEVWISPVTQTRLWRVNSFPYVHAPNGNIIGNINEQKDETENKALIEETGLNYNSEIKVPPITVTGSNDDKMDCHGGIISHTRNSSRSVKVGIFDTGCSYPSNWMQYNYFFDIGNYTEYDYVHIDPIADDQNSHGTHVASVIAHTVNRYAGGQGLNLPQVDFDIRKTFAANGLGQLSTILLAFEEALIDGMQIANMSFSFSEEPSVAYAHPFYSSLEAGLNQYRILLVCASGNDGENMDVIDLPNYPASYDLDNIISISTFDCSNDLAQFANYGPEAVDIAGPGIKIPGLIPEGSGSNGFNIGYKTGTSQSTSIITGIAASLATHQSSFDYAMIKCAIISSAEWYANVAHKVVSDGVVNADKALAWLLNNCQLPPPNGGGSGHGLNAGSRNKTSFDELGVYPNPASGQISIQFDTNITGNFNLSIVDVLARDVYTEKLNATEGLNNFELNLSTFSNGIYYLILDNDTERIVKQITIID